ncbi:helix-turn-helix transcriptional regulator [Alkaliphilus oremlandii]|uniref:Transcriptional regulator, XRE family n=1 Tax=Alkaliphilus oremlandii (strain OhILAs) TaxID=350688 RepID=A8MHW0_ALKOO|nr:helix-turn-helix transcriptional regulator [Alkaliphilus oremlandii]ABW19392.1 transcriptional regulator, XRE family [Alkaliphilus oremlandii OhILAs]
MRINMIKRRKELGLTQKDIAKKINKGRSTYASYEVGTISPSLKTSLLLKKILNSDDDIFLDTNVTQNDYKII